MNIKKMCMWQCEDADEAVCKNCEDFFSDESEEDAAEEFYLKDVKDRQDLYNEIIKDYN